MNESFDGLNLTQLIDLLEPLVMPPAVVLVPLTPGWWVVGGWLLLVILIVSASAYRRWRDNAYRREAIRSLQLIIDSRSDGCAADIATLVKRTALAAYPREQVAGLTGSQWAEFLQQTAAGDRAVVAAAGELARAAYQSDIDPSNIVAGARGWIRRHRV